MILWGTEYLRRTVSAYGRGQHQDQPDPSPHEAEGDEQPTHTRLSVQAPTGSKRRTAERGDEAGRPVTESAPRRTNGFQERSRPGSPSPWTPESELPRLHSSGGRCGDRTHPPTRRAVFCPEPGRHPRPRQGGGRIHHPAGP